jgi:hypothetical protein
MPLEQWLQVAMSLGEGVQCILSPLGYSYTCLVSHSDSGGLCLLIEPLLHLLESFVIHGKRVNNFWRLLWRGTGGSRW